MRDLARSADPEAGRPSLRNPAGDGWLAFLQQCNDTDTPEFHGHCLPRLFEDQVSLTPGLVAVHSEWEGAWTYAELNARSNQIARFLRARAVSSNTRVGVCMERSIWMPAVLLGVAKAGGAYVPLSPSDPLDRLRYQIADAGVALLLTDEDLVSRFSGALGGGVRVLSILGEASPIARNDGANLETQPSSEDLAYVIYTSGSTGRPKGVMIPHASVCNWLLWMRREYPMDPSDCVLQQTPFAFDVSVCELFGTLLAGARLEIPLPGGHRDADYLARLIQTRRVTAVHFVPAMLNAFLDCAEAPRCRTIRLVFAAGEALTEPLAARHHALLDAELHNLYGPTEAGVVSCWPCPAGSGAAAIPIGVPIANTRLHILSEQMELLPAETPGELYIGGLCLARGYVGHPDLTAACFVPDPFGSSPGGRLYRTGDLCRRRADGAIEFLGRLDDQVKIRGHRIEMGEIEGVLTSHPGVAGAVVLAPEVGGERRLAAYLSPAGAGEVSGDQLRAYARDCLPSYMVPDRFVFLPELPKTPNGKIDRRVLPDVNWSEGDAEGEFTPPSTPIETTLAQIWRDVLGLSRIGVHASFFDLGGHSLLGAQVMTRIRAAFHVDLPLSALFAAPTVAKLAAAVAAAMMTAGDEDLTWLLDEIEAA